MGRVAHAFRRAYHGLNPTCALAPEVTSRSTSAAKAKVITQSKLHA